MDIFRDDLITLREVSDAYWKLEFRFIGLLTHFGRRLSSPINEWQFSSFFNCIRFQQSQGSIDKNKF